MVTDQQLVQSDTKVISYSDQMKFEGGGAEKCWAFSHTTFQEQWVPVLQPTLPPRIAFVDLLKAKKKTPRGKG